MGIERHDSAAISAPEEFSVVSTEPHKLRTKARKTSCWHLKHQSARSHDFEAISNNHTKIGCHQGVEWVQSWCLISGSIAIYIISTSSSRMQYIKSAAPASQELTDQRRPLGSQKRLLVLDLKASPPSLDFTSIRKCGALRLEVTDIILLLRMAQAAACRIRRVWSIARSCSQKLIERIELIRIMECVSSQG